MCKDNWSSVSNPEVLDSTTSQNTLTVPNQDPEPVQNDMPGSKIHENVWGVFESKENFINLHLC